MPALLVALAAFLQEHHRCGDLDAGVEGGRVWMACAAIVRAVRPDVGPIVEPA